MSKIICKEHHASTLASLTHRKIVALFGIVKLLSQEPLSAVLLPFRSGVFDDLKDTFKKIITAEIFELVSNMYALINVYSLHKTVIILTKVSLCESKAKEVLGTGERFAPDINDRFADGSKDGLVEPLVLLLDLFLGILLGVDNAFCMVIKTHLTVLTVYLIMALDKHS